MGRSRRGRRCLDSVEPLMHFGYRSQTPKTSLCPGLVRSPRQHGSCPKLLLDCIFSNTSQRTCLSKLLNHHFFIRLIGDVGPEASIAQPEVLDSAHAA